MYSYSRSIDYNSYSNNSPGYGANQGYYSDPVSFPTITPYSYSNPQINQYSYHQPSQGFPQSFKQILKQQINRSINTKPLQNKSFLDAFDNNNSALLNQQKSHARNIKGRLFNNQDPNLQQAKMQKQNLYREQLQRQIQQANKRKQQEKDKIQKQEMERERKFYQEFKIQAQVKQDKDNKNDKKEDNGYFMARTLHKIKKSKHENSKQIKNKDNQTLNLILNPPAKGRGKTYQNKSSLDNWGDVANSPNSPNIQQKNDKNYNQINETPHKGISYKLSKMEQQIIKQRSNEQQRLSKLLLFQQRVLQKINDIKTDIRNTAFDVDSDKQLQRIRNNLRAKPIPFDDDLFKSGVKRNNFDSNHYYSLPKRQLRVPTTRYSVKLKDINQNKMQTVQKSVKSQVDEVLNDKNKLAIFNQQNQQNTEQQKQLQ